MASYFIAWKMKSERQCQARIVHVPLSAVAGKELRNLLAKELGMASAPTARAKKAFGSDVLVMYHHPDGTRIEDDELVRSSSAVIVRRLPVQAYPAPPPLIG